MISSKPRTRETVHILVSNDDGYSAPGIIKLIEALSRQHHDVTVAAPADNKSGCGMGISLRRSILVEEIKPRFFVVEGSPADCVYLGLQNLTTAPVDMVVSGINNGPNMADDVLYSGTFAAAMEARHQSLPSIAMSIPLREVKHYETAAYIACKMISAISKLNYKSLISVLNVNVPDVPVTQLRGLQATMLGERQRPYKPFEEPRSAGKRSFRLGLAGDFKQNKHSTLTDFEAVEAGFVSITPLSARFEDRPFLADTQAWLDTL